MLWAVSESFVKQDDITVPDMLIPGANLPGYTHYSGHMGDGTFIEDHSLDPGHNYDPATHIVHLENWKNQGDVKIIDMVAVFDIPFQQDQDNPHFDPDATDDWATVSTTSQIIQRNKHSEESKLCDDPYWPIRVLRITQKWKLVPNPASEDIDLSNFFVGTYPLELQSLSFDTWCMKANVKVEETDGDTRVKEGGRSDEIKISLTMPPMPGVGVRIYGIPTESMQFATIPELLIYDETNWDVPQVITVEAVDDADASGR